MYCEIVIRDECLGISRTEAVFKFSLFLFILFHTFYDFYSKMSSNGPVPFQFFTLKIAF